jgi:hypothetical protein
MQAVNRHDQLQERSSLAGQHGFKKYYVKIALGLLDMVAVNVWIHYKLVNQDKCKKKTARYEFFNELSNRLLTTDWTQFLKLPAEKQTNPFSGPCSMQTRKEGTIRQRMTVSTTTEIMVLLIGISFQWQSVI